MIYLMILSTGRATNLSQVPEPGEDVVLKDPGRADMILQSQVFVQIDWYCRRLLKDIFMFFFQNGQEYFIVFQDLMSWMKLDNRQ